MAKNVVIIGGGAAGFMAAISFAYAFSAKEPVEITIVERLDRVGKKLLATGNGTCNLTNSDCSISRYHGGDKALAEDILDSFSPHDTIRFFESIGVLTRRDGDRIYPYSLQASSVLDCLRAEAARKGIRERCSSEVSRIQKSAQGWQVRIKNETVKADAVILTSGGRTAPSLGGGESGYALARQLGHTVSPVFPAIVPVKCSSPICKSLKGIRFDGKVSVLVDGKNYRTEKGEILFTEYGLSGPPIMQVARIVSEFHTLNHTVGGNPCRNVTLALDLMPEYTAFEIMRMVKERIAAQKGGTVENLLTGMLNKRLGQAVLKASGITPFSRRPESIMPHEMEILAQLINRWVFAATGIMGWPNAQATAGGVPLDEINAGTMESKKAHGIFLAGELLDIDGDCGGFNLQWAWSSGHLAGVSAARAVMGGGTCD